MRHSDSEIEEANRRLEQLVDELDADTARVESTEDLRAIAETADARSRRGAVPAKGLDLLAVGLDRLTAAIDDDLATATMGSGGFKATRGDYDSGKAFLTRWIAERARRLGPAELRATMLR